MAVVLTGATGLVGNAVLHNLLATEHEVVALVRSDDAANKVKEAGATAVVGDLTDSAWVAEQFANADGAIHTASPGDASSADFDRGIAEAAVNAFAGTGKRYVHTGGVWVHGPGTEITEDTPFNAPELTAWRADVERIVINGDLPVAIVEPGVVYSTVGGGLPSLVTTPDDEGNYRLIGDGSQHWTTIAADDLGALYVAVYDSDLTGYVIGVNDDHPTVREIADAAADGSPVLTESGDESRERLFAPLVEALLMDQQAGNARARSLGWEPVSPSLLDSIRDAPSETVEV